MSTAILVRCMDKRHTDKIGRAVRGVIGGSWEMYELTEPGGAGVLTNLFPEGREWLLGKMGIAIDNMHASHVFLTAHGSSEEDTKGCGGYVLSGFADEFSSAHRSKVFVSDELRKAAAVVRERYPSVHVRAFYITFDAHGENIPEEVDLTQLQKISSERQVAEATA